MAWLRRVREKQISSLVVGGLHSLSKAMSVFAAVVLGLMMLLIVADVSGRYLFNQPVKGTYELIGLLLVCAATLGIAFCETQRVHIRVRIFLDRFPPRIQAAVDSLAYLIALSIFSIIAWQMFIRAAAYASMELGRLSEVLQLPFWPFFIIFGISIGMFCIILLINLIESLVKVARC